MSVYRGITMGVFNAIEAHIDTLSATQFTANVGLPVASTNTAALQTYQTSVTVNDLQTTGKEAAIGMPANFLPMCVLVDVTLASTNPCNLVDIGDDAVTNSYVDGLAIDLSTVGFKGVYGCNGARGITGLSGALTVADEVEIVVSADPGTAGDPGDPGVTVRLTFVGILAS